MPCLIALPLLPPIRHAAIDADYISAIFAAAAAAADISSLLIILPRCYLP